MKPIHVVILMLVVLGMLYVVSLGIGARFHSDEGPGDDPEAQRTFDISESYPSIGSIGRWFSPKMELPKPAYTLEEGEDIEIDLPAAEDRYRRLELEVTEPDQPDSGMLEVTYRPDAEGDDSYPENLREKARWPENDEELPRGSFLILKGGGQLTMTNKGAERLKVEVR